MRTRRLRRLRRSASFIASATSATSAAVLAGLLLTSCGTQKASGDATAAVDAAAAKAPAGQKHGAPNGIEKLDADEAVLRSREAMAGLKSLKRVFTPDERSKESPLITSEADLRSGCALRYDFGTYGKTDVRFTTTGESPIVYMRLDRAAMKNEHGEKAAARYAGKFVADDQPDIMIYQRLVAPCELDTFSMENTEPGPGTTYKKGERTEIDGMPVLAVEQTNEGGGAQTAYIALRGEPYIVRMANEVYRQDLSRFDEKFGVKAPLAEEVVPMDEFTKTLGIEGPHWEVDIH